MTSSLSTRVAAGRRAMLERARISFRSECPAYAAMLADDDAAGALLEPFAHACFLRPGPFPLAQFLYGRLPRAQRPSHIELLGDEDGFAYVPGLGLAAVGATQAPLEVACATQAWTPLPTIPGTSLELYPRRHPLFRSYLDGHGGDQYQRTDVERATRAISPLLARGCALLRRIDPNGWQEICEACRVVVVFDNPDVPSFASLTFLGASFLNVSGAVTELGLAEDLVHQSAHNAFFLVVEKGGDVFTIPPRTSLSELTVRQDRRSVYDALHGLYTLASMGRFFEHCLADSDFPTGARHELVGRLALALRFFRNTLEVMGDERLYTKVGLAIFHELAAYHEHLSGRWGALARTVDVSDQSAPFNYPRFCATNAVLVA